MDNQYPDNPNYDYQEFRFTPDHPSEQIRVWFVPDDMFIYNPTDAPMYINSGSGKIPTPDNADLVIQPNSYYYFVPYKNTQEFGVLLDNPTAWTAILFLRKGGANLKKIFPNADAQLTLPPMPDPTVHAAFTFTVL